MDFEALMGMCEGQCNWDVNCVECCSKSCLRTRMAVPHCMCQSCKEYVTGCDAGESLDE